MAESIDIRELNERIERQSAFVTNLTTGMDQIIVGQKHLVESLLIGLLSDGHVLLEGLLIGVAVLPLVDALGGQKSLGLPVQGHYGGAVGQRRFAQLHCATSFLFHTSFFYDTNSPLFFQETSSIIESVAGKEGEVLDCLLFFSGESAIIALQYSSGPQAPGHAG